MDSPCWQYIWALVKINSLKWKILENCSNILKSFNVFCQPAFKKDYSNFRRRMLNMIFQGLRVQESRDYSHVEWVHLTPALYTWTHYLLQSSSIHHSSTDPMFLFCPCSETPLCSSYFYLIALNVSPFPKLGLCLKITPSLATIYIQILKYLLKILPVYFIK